jgi:hypothetical protein
MLCTFLVASTTTVLGDDRNFATGGVFAFRWENWSVDGLLHKEPLYGAAAPFKAGAGNLDRVIGFRIGTSLASVAAVAAFLKTVDARVLSQGTLVLQPDATALGVMTYALAILKSAKLVASADESTGMRVTISYSFECLTVV